MLLKKSTWFISDLHLDVSRPHLFQLFYHFIEQIRGNAAALYILGDLFEFWVGDDLIDDPAGKPYLPILQKIKSLSDAGIPVFFIQGNRDFLVQRSFIQAIGATLLPDSQVIDLYGTPTLVMHGDTLCTDDKAYQRMRRLFRMKILQNMYLSLSVNSRLKRAQRIHQITHKKTRQKSTDILDVNQHAVIQAMKKAGVSQLIHGHTHRPAEHHFRIEEKPATRIVLGDWHDKACYLECGPQEMNLVY